MWYNIFKKKENYMTSGTDITVNETIPFSPDIKGGRVIKVYDADTITIAAKLPYKGSPLYRFSVRLYGIDAPEIKGKTHEETCVAIQARDALKHLILNEYVTLKIMTDEHEKWGRILAEVYLDQLHVNDWLLRHNYVVPYDGGTKKTPKSWLKYRVTGEYE